MIEQTFQNQITEFIKHTGYSELYQNIEDCDGYILRTAHFESLKVMMLYNPESKTKIQTWLVWDHKTKLNGMGKTLEEAYSDLMDQNLKYSLAAMYDRFY